MPGKIPGNKWSFTTQFGTKVLILNLKKLFYEMDGVSEESDESCQLDLFLTTYKNNGGVYRRIFYGESRTCKYMYLIQKF